MLDPIIRCYDYILSVITAKTYVLAVREDLLNLDPRNPVNRDLDAIAISRRVTRCCLAGCRSVSFGLVLVNTVHDGPDEEKCYQEQR